MKRLLLVCLAVFATSCSGSSESGRAESLVASIDGQRLPIEPVGEVNGAFVAFLGARQPGPAAAFEQLVVEVPAERVDETRYPLPDDPEAAQVYPLMEFTSSECRHLIEASTNEFGTRLTLYVEC